MLPRPRPETIADAISMVVSGRRVAALFAHSRERDAESNFQALPAKRRRVLACGDEREVTEAAEQWKLASARRPFPQFAGTILSPS